MRWNYSKYRKSCVKSRNGWCYRWCRGCFACTASYWSASIPDRSPIQTGRTHIAARKTRCRRVHFYRSYGPWKNRCLHSYARWYRNRTPLAMSNC